MLSHYMYISGQQSFHGMHKLYNFLCPFHSTNKQITYLLTSVFISLIFLKTTNFNFVNAIDLNERIL